jgi:phenylalanyl-tRNA synthetase alpha chain
MRGDLVAPGRQSSAWWARPRTSAEPYRDEEAAGGYPIPTALVERFTMTTVVDSSVNPLAPHALAAALDVDDLTDSDRGDRPHALALMVSLLVDGLSAAWRIPAWTVRPGRVVSVDDNYDRLGYAPSAVTRDARYTRYVSETTLLRSHTSAGVPYALGRLAREGTGAPDDVLLALPGVVYRRDAIDRLHTGTPHQLDLWRVTRSRTFGEPDLQEMLTLLLGIALPGMEWRTTPADHPYTTRGRQVDVRVGAEWVEVAECGLAAGHVLQRAGLMGWSGLALGMGLDRIVMLRKNIPDIRLLRSSDPRVKAQMSDLSLYRPVSNRPPVRRDLSLAVSEPVDEELLGDRVRDALGAQATAVESVELLSVTPYAQMTPAARARIGLDSTQVNALVRIVLRAVDRTLTDAEANELRDRIYAVLHEGSVAQWVSSSGIRDRRVAR